MRFYKTYKFPTFLKIKSICLCFLFVFGIASLSAQKISKAEQKSDYIKTLVSENIDKAEKLSLKFLDEGLQRNDNEVIARSNYLLGIIKYYKSNFYTSNKYYEAALKSDFAKKNLSFKEACFNNMGVNYDIQNMFPQAIVSYNESLKIAQKLKDSTSIYQSMINLGLLNAKSKKYNLALFQINEANSYFERINDKANMALCYENLSFVSNNSEKYNEAIYYTRKALSLFTALNNELKIAACYYNLSHNYLLTDEIEIADGHIKKAISIVNKIGYTENLSVKLYLQVAQIEIAKGNYKLAELNLQKALDINKNEGSSEKLQLIYDNYMNLYAKSGEYDKYSRIVYRANKEENDNLQRLSFARVDELRELFEFEIIKQKIKKQESDIQKQKSQLTILISIILVIIFLLVVFITMYVRMRNYTKLLFQNILTQTTHDELTEINTDLSLQSDNLFALFNQILVFIKEKPEKLTIGEISKALNAQEEDIAKAITLHGNRDFKSFLNHYFVEEICKKIIRKGKAISIQNLVSDSPFKSTKELQKNFKEITGLSIEKFIIYSEEKLQWEKKN